MRYRVTLETTMEPAPSEEKEERVAVAFLERILELLESSGGIDADAGGTFATGEVHISTVVEAVDPDEAFSRGTALIRQAVEAAGGGVEEWSRERFILEPEEDLMPLAIASA